MSTPSGGARTAGPDMELVMLARLYRETSVPPSRRGGADDPWQCSCADVRLEEATCPCGAWSSRAGSRCPTRCRSGPSQNGVRLLQGVGTVPKIFPGAAWPIRRPASGERNRSGPGPGQRQPPFCAAGCRWPGDGGGGGGDAEAPGQIEVAARGSWAEYQRMMTWPKSTMPGGGPAMWARWTSTASSG